MKKGGMGLHSGCPPLPRTPTPPPTPPRPTSLLLSKGVGEEGGRNRLVSKGEEEEGGRFVGVGSLSLFESLGTLERLAAMCEKIQEPPASSSNRPMEDKHPKTATEIDKSLLWQRYESNSRQGTYKSIEELFRELEADQESKVHEAELAAFSISQTISRRLQQEATQASKVHEAELAAVAAAAFSTSNTQSLQIAQGSVSALWMVVESLRDQIARVDGKSKRMLTMHSNATQTSHERQISRCQDIQTSILPAMRESLCWHETLLKSAEDTIRKAKAKLNRTSLPTDLDYLDADRRSAGWTQTELLQAVANLIESLNSVQGAIKSIFEDMQSVEGELDGVRLDDLKTARLVALCHLKNTSTSNIPESKTSPDSTACGVEWSLAAH